MATTATATKKTPNMRPPRKHHIVSRTYLKAFCEPEGDRVLILDFASGNVRRQRPEKILHQRDYFRKVYSSLDKQYRIELEKAIVLDEPFQAIRRKLCQGGVGLDGDELAVFAMAMAFQHVTTPRYTDYLLAQVGGQLDPNRSEIADMLGAFHTREAVQMLSEKQKCAVWAGGIIYTFRSLLNMTWSVYETSSDCVLISSDNPVIVIDENRPNCWTGNPAASNSKVLFPITPSHVLVLTHTNSESATSHPRQSEFWPRKMQLRIPGEKLTYAQVDEVNLSIAERADRYIIGNEATVLENVAGMLEAPTTTSHSGTAN